ncbi:MAG: hypothetical protein P1U35_12985 [Cycloclasticus sp.]|nr:hypothetical protein [Cycloclasticus sp.]
MTLKDFTENFVYRYDPKSYDQWRIPKLEDGKYEGDCEDHALGVLYYVVCDESLFTFWYQLIFGQAKIHYVDNNGGHAVLQLDGMYIDNWTKEWVTKEHMESLGHVFHPWMFNAYQVALKMIYAKIRGIF